MEQVQAEMADMRVQMSTQMGQFLEIIQNLARGQEELRAMIVRPATTEAPVVNPPVGGAVPFPQANVVPILGQRGVEIPEPRLEVDNHEDMFSMQGDDMGFPAEAEKKFQMLEERMRAMESHDIPGMNISDLGLVPGVKIPPKFKVPDFDKYKGTTCPKIHIRAYYRKMSAYSDDEKLLMHFFQDSLSGASLEWYMQLEITHVRSWRDLAEAFIKHYQYNTDMAPNRTQLQSLVQRPNETFKEYAQKWRELAARVQPPMVEKELVDMFMGTLQGHYYEKMIGCTFPGFSDLVTAGERIEYGIKVGKIQVASSSSNGAKKPFVGFPKKKEEVNAASCSRVNAVSIPVAQQ